MELPKVSTHPEVLARHIFRHAENTYRVFEWEALLGNLSRLVRSEEFSAILHDEATTRADLHDLMDHLLAEAKPKDWQRKFINSLIDRDLLELVPHIHKSFSNMRHAAVNSHHVTIFTPEKLQPFQHDNLRNYLKERFNIKTRSITAVIDRDMLSGVKIKAGPKTIDQSRRR